MLLSFCSYQFNNLKIANLLGKCTSYIPLVHFFTKGGKMMEMMDSNAA